MNTAEKLDNIANSINIGKVRTDGGTQPRAAVYQNVIDEYAEALSGGAIFPPVVVYYDGSDYWLADGFHRHAGHKKAGRSEITADIRQGTRRDAVLYSVGANSQHGLRRTNEDKRRAVLTLLQDAEWARKGYRWIASKCAVSDFMVRQYASAIISQMDRPAEKEVERNGVTYLQNTANIGRPAIAQQPEVRMSSEPANDNNPPIIAKEVNVANDNEPHNHRAQGTGENEWYTPTQYVELARSVMGGFDVDPASNPIAQNKVRATTYYTEETNGLDKEWNGRVWLNPPYAQPAISHFADKTVEEVQSGRCTEAIVLTHNYTDTGWFQKLARAATAICFTKGRIRFESPSGEKASPTQGQAFFYFGPNIDAFVSAFDGEVGFVVEVK